MCLIAYDEQSRRSQDLSIDRCRGSWHADEKHWLSEGCPERLEDHLVTQLLLDFVPSVLLDPSCELEGVLVTLVDDDYTDIDAKMAVVRADAEYLLRDNV